MRRAVEVVLDKGYRTGDLGVGPGQTLVGTRAMGQHVRDALR